MPSHYKKGTPEYKAYKQGKKKKGSGFDKFLSTGGLGLAGLLISSVKRDGRKK